MGTIGQIDPSVVGTVRSGRNRRSIAGVQQLVRLHVGSRSAKPSKSCPARRVLCNQIKYTATLPSICLHLKTNFIL